MILNLNVHYLKPFCCISIYGGTHRRLNVDFNTVTYNCWDDNLSDQGFERAIEMTPKMEAALEWLQSLGSELAKFKTRVNSYNS